jgi:tRNA dimethylallyltransferase
MTPEPFHDVHILTGPTGCGKTALSLELAERLGAEIVAMDSMTLYRGLDIGTAKPTPTERSRVPHHLLDVLDPWESASVAWWLERAAVCCRDIQARGKRALFVGGTPLYLKALLYGLFDGPPGDAALRQRLLAEAEEVGHAALHQRLARLDPVSAARLHPNDVRRVVRALEVWELTGKPISAWQSQWAEGRRQKTEGGEEKPGGSPRISGLSSLPSAFCLLPSVLCLDLPRAELYARINARVNDMIARGLVDEVRALRRLPRPLSREAAQALGYQEVADHLDGRAALAETVVRIQTRTRQFAKRQLTWFRHLPECRPVTRQLTFDAWGLTMND